VVPRYHCGAITIDNENILLFSGLDENGKSLTDVNVLNIATGSIFGNENVGKALNLY
jgi:hypothetical protein